MTTYRAVTMDNRGRKSIAVSESLRRITSYISRTHGARRLPAKEYEAWCRRMPDEGGHPPVLDLDRQAADLRLGLGLPPYDYDEQDTTEDEVLSRVESR